MQNVIYRSPFIPPEWIASHSLEPVRLAPSGKGENKFISDSEGICPFMRSFVNEAEASSASAVILTTSCDQMRHAYDHIAGKWHSPVFLFNLPATWLTSASFKIYISELERLGRFLGDVSGKSPANTEIVSAMLEYDSKRHRASWHTSTTLGSIPIALLGGSLSQLDLSIIDLISNNNGTIVLDGTEEGERAIPAAFDRRRINDDPLTQLAESYFGTIPDISQRPNSRLYQWLETRIQERQPRGVILMRQTWCDLWHAEASRLRAWLKIPLLDIDLNGDDPIPCNKTRIQAFMEALA